MPTEFGSGVVPRTSAEDRMRLACVRCGKAVLFWSQDRPRCASVAADPARTRNPSDIRRTPGGSSSGTAAAVAARMLPVALGTHARGSTIRRRASAAPKRSSPHSARSTGRVRSRWPTAWTILAYLPPRCPTCDDGPIHCERAGGDPSHPGLYGEPRPARAPQARASCSP